jgi:hypothetical protein
MYSLRIAAALIFQSFLTVGPVCHTPSPAPFSSLNILSQVDFYIESSNLCLILENSLKSPLGFHPLYKLTWWRWRGRKMGILWSAAFP